MDRKDKIRIVIGIVLVLFLAIISWKVFLAPAKMDDLTVEEAQKIVLDRFQGEIKDTILENDVYNIFVEAETGAYTIQIAKNNGEILNIERTRIEKVAYNLSENVIRQIIREQVPGVIEAFEKVRKDKVDYYYATVITKNQKVKLTLSGATGEIIEQQEEQLNEAPEGQESAEGKGEAATNQETMNKAGDGETQQGTETKEPEKPPVKEPVKEPEKEPVRNITEKEAIQIALKMVSGEVDDVDFKVKNGQPYYFIEIETADDWEAEIQIHAISGKVINIEWDD